MVYGVLIAPYPYARPNQIWATQVRDVKNPRQGWPRRRLSEIVEMRKLPAAADPMATRNEVFQVPATGPASILGVVALLAPAALLACLVPARRAARLDPLSALRHE